MQSFEAIEGTRFGVLFSFAKGEKPKSNSEELEFSIGNFMAKFHQQTEGVELPRIQYSPQILLDDSIERIGQYLQKDSEEFLFLKKFQQCFYLSLIHI